MRDAMIVAVTGGRDFNDRVAVYLALDLFNRDIAPIGLLVEGGARGADRLAREWANENHVHVATVNAIWEGPNRRYAGPIRNQAMAQLNLDALIAFPGGNGTHDMTKRCRARGIRVLHMVQGELTES